MYFRNMALFRAGSFVHQMIKADKFLSSCAHALANDERTRVYVTDIQNGFIQVCLTIDRIASSAFKVVNLLSYGIEKLPTFMCHDQRGSQFYLAFKVWKIHSNYSVY
jgi:hypothetical protein